MNAKQILWPVCVTALLVPSSPAWYQQDNSDLNARLESLAGEIEQRLDEYHAPGAALAIVRNDEVIFARGFGLADVENQVPASPETPFFIGSTTKAFTATLVRMLVDDGLVDWDDPVEEYLPYFSSETRYAGRLRIEQVVPSG